MFGISKKKETPSDTIDIGSDVEYLKGNTWRKGIVHAVRKVDSKSGPVVTGYLVDNGKKHLKDTIITEGDEDNIEVSQPIQVDVTPENIRLAE